MCKCIYQKSKGTPLFHSYGGFAKRITVCSDTCAKSFIDLIGTDRAGLKRKDIRNQFLIK
jgi:hypothetical protein